MTGLSLGLSLHHGRRPLVTPRDWGTVAYTYTNDKFINASGVETSNATFRYAKIPVETFWEAIKVSGVYNIGSAQFFCVFLDVNNAKTGSYLAGTGANVTLDPEGNGRIPWPLPANTKYVCINQLKVNTAFTVQAKNTRVMVIGDSTSMNGGNGIGDNLATTYGSRTVYQQGIGGQLWQTQIKYRLGLADTTITITGNAIPTSGTAACTLAQSILKHNTTNVVVQVRVNGVRCALLYTQATDSYTIQALDTIAAPVAVSAGTSVKVITGVVIGASPDVTTCPTLADMLTGSTWIVRSCPSINDRFSYANLTPLQTAQDDLIAYARRWGAKLCLVGIMNGELDLPSGTYPLGQATSAAQSAGFLSFVAGMNTSMSTKAAANSTMAKFVDVLANHIANGGSTTETINGTQYAVLNNLATTPKLADGRHETTTAQAETTTLIKSALDPLGW